MWNYQSAGSDYRTASNCSRTMKCRFCRLRLRRSSMYFPLDPKEPGKGSRLIRGCTVCGWWTSLSQKTETSQNGLTSTIIYANVGILKTLSPTGTTTAIEEVKQYLEKKQESRYAINPKQFEEVVASVYRELGYQVRVTGQRNDGGIDVILDGPGNKQIGIQVKRWRRKIQAEEIRSLAGALFIKGIPEGIFVTTSDFTNGATATAKRLSLIGLPVKLVNWESFFDAMKIGRVKSFDRLFGPDHISTKVRMYQVQQIFGTNFDGDKSVFNDHYLDLYDRYHEDEKYRSWIAEQYP